MGIQLIKYLVNSNVTDDILRPFFGGYFSTLFTVNLTKFIHREIIASGKSRVLFHVRIIARGSLRTFVFTMTFTHEIHVVRTSLSTFIMDNFL